MVQEIIGLETRYPDARVLVTSRIPGFDADPFERAGFAIATLDDLSEEQVATFAESGSTSPSRATRAPPGGRAPTCSRPSAGVPSSRRSPATR